MKPPLLFNYFGALAESHPILRCCNLRQPIIPAFRLEVLLLFFWGCFVLFSASSSHLV